MAGRGGGGRPPPTSPRPPAPPPPTHTPARAGEQAVRRRLPTVPPDRWWRSREDGLPGSVGRSLVGERLELGWRRSDDQADRRRGRALFVRHVRAVSRHTRADRRLGRDPSTYHSPLGRRPPNRAPL